MKDRALRLLAFADLLQLLTRAFAQPTPALREDLAYAPGELRELLSACGLEDDAVLERALLETVRVAHETPLDDWLAEHTRLFDCGVECPINETAYVRRDKGQLLGDVAGFYAAFGVRVEPGFGEKVDHLSCELEFCAVLLTLWARALDEDDATHAELCEGALRAFVRDHTGEWLSAFCLTLAETTRLQLFANAAPLLEHGWRSLCDSLALEARRDRPLRLVPERGTPYECGLADAGCS
ncbi:MAG: molecular chaperone [Planctomycetota bacterium]